MQEGDIYETFAFGDVEIIEYRGNREVDVRFLNTGYEMVTTKEQILRGSVKDKMAKTIYGVGYLGDGKYKATHMDRKPYLVWRSMIQRCYGGLIDHGKYVDCNVVDEWHNFQNFAEWFCENYVDGYELDKDIKVKGNRVYGPETCLFVTKQDNLAAKSVRVTMMNGISGEMLTFNSMKCASKHTGMSSATLTRVIQDKRCHKSGWFFVEFPDRNPDGAWFNENVVSHHSKKA